MTEVEWLECTNAVQMLRALDTAKWADVIAAFPRACVSRHPLSGFAEGRGWTVRMASPAAQVQILRCLIGNPFRGGKFSKDWRTDTVVTLARTMSESREFGAMPILADALQDAGCDNEDVLNHCRHPGLHVCGCWVVDFVLGKSEP